MYFLLTSKMKVVTTFFVSLIVVLSILLTCSQIVKRYDYDGFGLHKSYKEGRLNGLPSFKLTD